MTTPRRRWSFTLRLLFVVVTLLACSFGWKIRIVFQRREMLYWIAEHGGSTADGEFG